MPIPTPSPTACGSRITSILRRRSYGSQSGRGLVRTNALLRQWASPEVWRGEIRASCGGRHGDLLHASPCLDRCSVAESGMQPLPVVEHLDVIEHGRFGLRTGAEAAV